MVQTKEEFLEIYMKERQKELDPIKDKLIGEGYKNIKIVPFKGICAVYPFAFTVAIVYGIDKYGYVGRYCYPKERALEMMIAFSIWDGKSDPTGPWIKHKGKLEYSNPNLNTNDKHDMG